MRVVGAGWVGESPLLIPDLFVCPFFWHRRAYARACISVQPTAGIRGRELQEDHSGDGEGDQDPSWRVHRPPRQNLQEEEVKVNMVRTEAPTGERAGNQSVSVTVVDSGM